MKIVFFAACGVLAPCTYALAQELKPTNQEGVVRLISELIEERKASEAGVLLPKILARRTRS